MNPTGSATPKQRSKTAATGILLQVCSQVALHALLHRLIQCWRLELLPCDALIQVHVAPRQLLNKLTGGLWQHLQGWGVGVSRSTCRCVSHGASSCSEWHCSLAPDSDVNNVHAGEQCATQGQKDAACRCVSGNTHNLTAHAQMGETVDS
jgi:hypothetical protein